MLPLGRADKTIDEVIGALPPAQDRFIGTYAELDERVMKEGGGGPYVAGLVKTGSAVVIFEPNGSMGTNARIMRPVSAGREVATYYYGGRTAAPRAGGFAFHRGSAPDQRLRTSLGHRPSLRVSHCPVLC